MIAIDNVEASHPYLFPTVDFKFQNAGDAPAIITEFQVEIMSARIDVTPELEFAFDTRNNGPAGEHSLVLSVKNNGWGAARNCKIVVGGSLLQRIFPESQRTFVGSISSAEQREILILSPKCDPQEFMSIRNEQWERDHKERADLATPRKSKNNANECVRSSRSLDYRRLPERDLELKWGGRYFEESAGNMWIPMNSPDIEWSFVDEHGVFRSGQAVANFCLSFVSGVLFLRPNGFVFRGNQTQNQEMRSDITYCVIANPDDGEKMRRYPISRSILAGEVERFHIMIGATKSCMLNVRFGFSLGRLEEVKSSIFDVLIRNPVDSNWHRFYADGEEIRRLLQSEPMTGSGALAHEWRRQRAASQMQSFPFREQV